MATYKQMQEELLERMTNAGYYRYAARAECFMDVIRAFKIIDDYNDDERQRIATDKQSGYNEMGLEDQDMPDEGEELADEDLLDTQDQNFDDPEVGGGPIGKKLAVAQDKEEHYLPKTKSEKKEPNKK